MPAKKILLLSLLAALVAAFVALDLGRFSSLAAVKERQAQLAELYADRPLTVRDGLFHLLALRLVPLVPFFAVNLVMGLTGMLAGTVVYVNAGTQLARIDSLRGILSPGLLGSFALLGLFPLLARKALGVLQRRRKGAR